MVKRVECGLKLESKDLFYVTFQQNKPPAIKPCIVWRVGDFPVTRQLSLAEY
jgi:hypothetical protein